MRGSLVKAEAYLESISTTTSEIARSEFRHHMDIISTFIPLDFKSTLNYRRSAEESTQRFVKGNGGDATRGTITVHHFLFSKMLSATVHTANWVRVNNVCWQKPSLHPEQLNSFKELSKALVNSPHFTTWQVLPSQYYHDVLMFSQKK